MSIVSNMFAAQSAAWLRRWKAAADVDIIDQSVGPGGFYARDAQDANDLNLIGYDLDNQLKVGNSIQNPVLSQVYCHLYPNANMAATPFFVNPTNRPIYITGIQSIFTTAGTVAGAACTVTHETATSGTKMQGAGTGAVVMSGTFNLHGTAETLQVGTLAANYRLASRNTPSNAAAPGAGVIVLQPGDMLTLKFSGTLTTLVGLTVVLTVAMGCRWHFVSYYAAGAGAAATTSLMTALRKRTLQYGAAVWQTPEATAGTLTLDVTKDASATAPGAGTSVLSATANLKGAGLTYTQLGLSATAATLLFGPTDSAAVKISAAATELAGMLVTLAFDGKPGEIQIDYNGANSTVGTDEEIWIADRDYEVMDYAGKWSHIGTSNFLALTSEGGTSTPGSGSQILATDNTNKGFDTTGTINVPQFATLSALNTRFLRAGDRLGIHNQGTTGALAGMQLSTRLFGR